MHLSAAALGPAFTHGLALQAPQQARMASASSVAIIRASAASFDPFPLPACSCNRLGGSRNSTPRTIPCSAAAQSRTTAQPARPRPHSSGLRASNRAPFGSKLPSQSRRSERAHVSGAISATAAEGTPTTAIASGVGDINSASSGGAVPGVAASAGSDAAPTAGMEQSSATAAAWSTTEVILNTCDA